MSFGLVCSSSVHKSITYLLGAGVLDLLGWKKIPVRVQATGLLLNIVIENAVSSIWAEDECVDMGELVSFTGNILLDQVVGVIVGKDSMHFLRAVATDIGTKHDAARKKKNGLLVN